ncbi:MAG: DegT/DnrJ/EryC1/StrS family aminotransferase [Patescibacteria group bacterium]
MGQERTNILIPTQRAHFDDGELLAIQKVLNSRWTGRGPITQQLERQFLNLTEAQYAIAVQSGTAALHLALEVSKELGVINPGQKVIVPSQTFAATIQAIDMSGLTPVFCDVQPNTLNMDPWHLAQLIDSETKIILPVHYRGEVCDMDTIMAVAGRSNLWVVEDAAHALGSTYNGRPVGSLGHITCFSMDHIKNGTMIEGGIVTTNISEVAHLVSRMSNLGFHQGEIQGRGFRYHATDYNAAVGTVQLGRLEEYKTRRREIAHRYQEDLKNIPGLGLLDICLTDTVPFMYVALVTDNKRDGLKDFLQERGIETLVRYDPNHLQPYFVNKFGPTSLPVTEETYSQLLVLPLFYELTDSQQGYVIESIEDFFSKV